MNNGLKVAGIVFLLLLTLSSVRSDPPEPFNVKGFVFHNDSSRVENGIPVRINDTTLGTYTDTEVFAPPIPPLMGAYSTTHQGNTGNSITVYAWNDTHYGYSSATLSSTIEVNVTINLTRPPEANLTIHSPDADSLQERGELFNLTVNVTVLGSGAICSVTIDFEDISVLNISSGETLTHNLGLVPLGTTVQTNFSIHAHGIGNSSITANASCAGQDIYLVASPWDVVTNITVQDTLPPTVTLIWPPNNTLNKTSNFLNFTYNVTDASPIDSCELIINILNNASATNVPRGITNNFSTSLNNGLYNWSVNCTDDQSNEGASVLYNLTLEVFYPNISIVSLTQGIVLVAGSMRVVECNATIDDLDGYANILSANVTFFVDTNTSGDPDNPNYHYSNSSCAEVGTVGNQKNFTCTMPLWYFAVNGTWLCNVSTIDAEGLVDNESNTTSVDSLFALNVTDILMDFGDVEAGYSSTTISQNISNLGNQPLNVTVYGYGGSPGDGNAFSCGISNVSVGNMKFAANDSATFDEMESLDGSLKQLRMNIPKQTVVGSGVTNTSYWQVFIPKNVSDVGFCNGTIVFHAALS